MSGGSVPEEREKAAPRALSVFSLLSESCTPGPNPRLALPRKPQEFSLPVFPLLGLEEGQGAPCPPALKSSSCTIHTLSWGSPHPGGHVPLAQSALSPSRPVLMLGDCELCRAPPPPPYTHGSWCQTSLSPHGHSLDLVITRNRGSSANTSPPLAALAPVFPAPSP